MQNLNYEMTESVYVSLAYRYAVPAWTQEKNREIFGVDASIDGIGGNLRVELTWLATDTQISPKAELAHVKNLLDHRCLFRDEPWFLDRPSSLENITQFIAVELKRCSLTSGFHWLKLKVYESKNLKAIYEFTRNEMSLEFGFDLPIQWRFSEGGWGGGVWRGEVEAQGPVDDTSGLMFVRSQKFHEVESLLAPFVAKTYSIEGPRTLEDPENLIEQIATSLSSVKGFKSGSIATSQSQSYRFHG